MNEASSLNPTLADWQKRSPSRFGFTHSS